MGKLVPFPIKKIHYIDVGSMTKAEARAVAEKIYQEIFDSIKIAPDPIYEKRMKLAGGLLQISDILILLGIGYVGYLIFMSV